MQETKHCYNRNLNVDYSIGNIVVTSFHSKFYAKGYLPVNDRPAPLAAASKSVYNVIRIVGGTRGRRHGCPTVFEGVSEMQQTPTSLPHF